MNSHAKYMGEEGEGEEGGGGSDISESNLYTSKSCITLLI